MRSVHRINNENIVRIDTDKCVGCGLCVKDCVGEHLFLTRNGAAVKPGACPECGHCYAICPRNAVTLEVYGFSGAGEPPYGLDHFDSALFLRALKSRRSCRHFQKKKVPENVLETLLEAGRFSPTASNKQDVHFTVLQNLRTEIERIAVEFLRSKQREGTETGTFMDRTITEDYFFKGAPLVLLVSAENLLDAGLSAAYIELMAYNLGLGVLYSGYFQYAFACCEEIRKLVGLPENKQLGACLVLGYPELEYERIVPRYSPYISWR